jgi:ribosome-binding protein aMBF1 (putative translation factor)
VDKRISPIGSFVEDDIQDELRTDPEYRAIHEARAPFEAIARAVIMRRAELGMSQAELARRAGTTASAISRMERGQHRTRPETLKKVAEALGGHAVVGFAFGGEPQLIRL